MTSRLLLLLVLLSACSRAGGGSPTTPEASADSSEPPRFEQWMIVREVRGRGLTPGSGVRVRTEAMDVVSGTLASVMDGTCSGGIVEIVCSGIGPEIHLRSGGGGRFVMEQGTLELELEAASASEIEAFEAALAATDAQATACAEAAACCIAAEAEDGIGCDLDVELGDRSLSTCSRAREAARSRFRNGPAPEVCH